MYIADKNSSNDSLGWWLGVDSWMRKTGYGGLGVTEWADIWVNGFN